MWSVASQPLASMETDSDGRDNSGFNVTVTQVSRVHFSYCTRGNIRASFVYIVHVTTKSDICYIVLVTTQE